MLRRLAVQLARERGGAARTCQRAVSEARAQYGAEHGSSKAIPSPRHGEMAAVKLKKALQALSRCKRRRMAVETVARLHLKVRRQHLGHAHKTALDLVREHDVIAHEDLKIRNMGKAPEPGPDPRKPGSFLPNGAGAKAGLNHSIGDGGWGGLAVLAAKAEGTGQVIAVDPRNTSQRCPAGGHTAQENRPTQDKFHCQTCGHNAHADTVGEQDTQWMP
ncbi:RNA-guided endonuclease InsQ/TnpB family protein [Streptomyces chiangmaiensis]